jgi:hypothetical protein
MLWEERVAAGFPTAEARENRRGSTANQWYNCGMTPKLTDEMRQSLSEHPGQPVYVVDASTQKSYVLVPADTYQKVQALLYDDSQPNPNEFLPLVHEALKDDWNAPGMESYDNYDAHRPKS